jgi:hypothetical protein
MKLLLDEKATHLVANHVPNAIPSKFVIIWNTNKSHESPIRLRARGFLEFVVRSPKDQLRPATLCSNPGVVQMSLGLGNFIGVEFVGGGSRDAVGAGASAKVVKLTAPIRI